VKKRRREYPSPAPIPSPEELVALIGRRGCWNAAPGIKVDVVVRAALHSYGHVILTIAPVAGTGSTNARLTSVELDAPENRT
jgi:hypothetical protein